MASPEIGELVLFIPYLYLHKFSPGNYDVIQQPKNLGKITLEKVPFYMFVDEETEASLKNSSLLDSRNRVGLWRIILVRNVPYSDARRNGKVCSPSFLLNPPISFKVSLKF